ncbi:DNA polymerase alpha catalytic subunit [Sarcoptes scabiei]|uniref:DNA-directed DNA polymerase n=1 Tax=Sarcoptes scabiei TaxID=52283 RepID=A0A834RGZ1_SARSC|nr:DNA polymerase alpha catalytic subunit [Sarcoptes scabiei]
MLSKMSFQTGRTRRTLNKNNAKKIEALERLKSLNQAGIKNRYEVEEEEKVYEEIDEDSYAELVSKRQREDWIVDDDGAGYAEHGREIFDDEYDDDDDDEQVDQIQNNRKIRNKYKLSKSKDSRKDENKKDIRNLISSMQKKNQISIANSASTSSGSKLSLKEVVINASVIDLVDSIAPKSNSSPLFNLKTTPQPLKLQKRTPTITPSSAKRKTSDISPKVNLPPFKRRSNLMTSEEFNFDEIVSEKNRCNPFAKIKSENDDKNVLNDFDLDDWSCSSLDVDEKSVNSNDASKKIDDEKKTSSAPSKAVESSSSKDGLYDEWIVSGSTNNEFKNQENLAQPFLKEIEFETDKENNKLLNFYWFDAFHDASNARNSDKIYLFGKIYNSKIQKYSSCCVQVHNLEHRIFLLPREKFLDDRVRNVQIEDVHKEFSEEVAPQLKIKHFRCRKVFKKYAFDVDSIPFEAEYLEISYPASMVQFPEKFMSGKTYRHVFGANSSILENFILDLNLMGPGWLELKNPQINDSPISWCKYEFIANDPRKQITKLSAKPATLPEPNFTILSLCFKSFVHVSTKMPEIIAISCLINRQFYLDSTDSKNNNHSKYDQHFCIVTKISNTTELPIDFNQKMALKEYKKTRIDVMNNERELLMFFMAKFQQIDPDIIIGHDIYHFDYDVLLQRFSHYKIPLQWSKLGRMKHSGLPSRIKEKHFLSGRLVCDTKILSKELIRSKSYDLTELAAQILRKGRFEIEQNLLPSYYENSSKLIRLIEFLMKDNDLILSIAFELNCLQLTNQITSIAGNLFSRTLLGGRSERNEFLLLHAFNERGYIVPDKHLSTSNSKKKASNINSIKEELDDTNLELIENDPKTINDSNKKSSYVGGLVLEPKIGYYDHFILLMDFNSLYPSIIQEYNICFTTIKSNPCSGVNEIVENVKEGILPVEIRKLVESRREVKLSLCRTDLSQNERSQLDIKQKALKITANSMYGCLGFIKSRFYAKHLASMITQREEKFYQTLKNWLRKWDTK